MTKVKRHGVIDINSIKKVFNKYNYKIESYTELEGIIEVIVKKDYSKNFNISFDGQVRLKSIFIKKMYEAFCYLTYPKFIELTDQIPKKPYCHINSDGSICYCPPQRPLEESWTIDNFINSVDSLINNYFSIEYIGESQLTELEHGEYGIKQYNSMRRE